MLIKIDLLIAGVENSLVQAFPKGISVMWNINSSRIWTRAAELISYDGNRLS